MENGDGVDGPSLSSSSTREGAPWRLCLLVDSLLSGRYGGRRDFNAAAAVAAVGDRNARGREEGARRDDCDDDDAVVAAEFLARRRWEPPLAVAAAATAAAAVVAFPGRSSDRFRRVASILRCSLRRSKNLLFSTRKKKAREKIGALC